MITGKLVHFPRAWRRSFDESGRAFDRALRAEHHVLSPEAPQAPKGRRRFSRVLRCPYSVATISLRGCHAQSHDGSYDNMFEIIGRPSNVTAARSDANEDEDGQGETGSKRRGFANMGSVVAGRDSHLRLPGPTTPRMAMRLLPGRQIARRTPGTQPRTAVFGAMQRRFSRRRASFGVARKTKRLGYGSSCY